MGDKGKNGRKLTSSRFVPGFRVGEARGFAFLCWPASITSNALRVLEDAAAAPGAGAESSTIIM